MSDQQVPTPSELQETHDATVDVVDSLRTYVTTMQGEGRIFTMRAAAGFRKSLQRLEASINPDRERHRSFARRYFCRHYGWPDVVLSALETICNATDKLLGLLNWQHLCDGKESRTPTPDEWPQLPESVLPKLKWAEEQLRPFCGGKVADPEPSVPTGNVSPKGSNDGDDCPMHVDVKQNRVTVDGTEHSLEPHQVQILNSLVEARKSGDWWVTGPNMRKLPVCEGIHVSREMKKLKIRIPPLDELIKAQSPRGYRLTRSSSECLRCPPPLSVVRTHSTCLP